jgi:ParB family chromosome partitioning protein
VPAKDLKDFAHLIAQTLDFKEQVIPEWFNIEETKDGYFVAVLQKGKWLADLQFKSLCTLMHDLNGDYIKGEKTFRVPGPLAKPRSPDTTSTPSPMDARSKAMPEIPNLKFIPVDAIKIPAFLPTRELVSYERLSEIRDSIKKHGLKYPIKVRRCKSDYELIDGYLRLQSVRQLGWKGILAEIKDATDQEVMVESLITNKHRIEEDPITVAKKLDMLVSTFGYTQEKVAEEIGLDRTTVAHTIRLLKLPKEIQHSVALHNVSFYHALLLLQVENPKDQLRLANEVKNEGLSTRQLEDRIKELKHIAPPEPSPEESPEEFPSLPEVPPQPEIKLPSPHPLSKATPCSGCTTPIWFAHLLKDGRTLCSLCFQRELKEGKISTEDIAEVEVPTAKNQAEPKAEVPFETPIGKSSSPLPTPPNERGPPKPEPLDIGEFECPECHQFFIVEHLAHNSHRLRPVKTVKEG